MPTTEENTVPVGSLNPTGRPLCLVIRNDPLAPVGEEYAACAGKELLRVDCLDRVPELINQRRDATSLTIVASGAALASHGIYRLAQELRAHPVRWGILTASTVERARRAISRITTRKSPDAMTMRLYGAPNSKAAGIEQEGLETFSLRSFPDPAAQIHFLQRATLSYFIGHGRHYCAISGNLCSREQGAGPGECIGGYRCMYRGHEPLSADRINSDVVVIDSCSTASTSNVTNEVVQRTNLAARVLDGHACAVLCHWDTSSPWHMSPYVVWSLAKSAFSLGSIQKTLNALQTSSGSGEGSWILFGDPDMQVTAPAGSLIEVMSKESLAVHTNAEITLPEPSMGVQLFRIESEEMVTHVRAHRLRNACSISEGDGLFQLFQIPQDPGAVYLSVAWLSRPAGSSVVTFTSSHPVSVSVLDSVRDYTIRLRQPTPWISVDAENQWERDLEVVEAALTSTQNIPLVSPRDYEALRSACEWLEGRRVLDQRKLMKSIADYARHEDFWVARCFRAKPGVINLGREESKRPCPRCSRLLLAHRYQVGLARPSRRIVFECPVCVFVDDVEEGQQPISIDLPAKLTSSEPNTVIVRGANPFDFRTPVHCMINFEPLELVAENLEVRMDLAAELIEAQAQFMFRFSINFRKPLDPHMYNCKSCVLLNGGLFWSARRFEIE